ncbi:MAG: outer membrane protein assembly factor BamB family protein [Planctomycetota bacterium]
MKKLLLSQIVLMVLLGAGVALGGDNWPTWRGPDTMGIASGGNPPLEWSETKNIKWKVKLEGDASNSSPVIWGDKIFFQTSVDTKIKDDTPTPEPAPMSGPGGRGGHPGGAPGGRPGGGERGGFRGRPGGGGSGGRPGGGGRGGRPGGGGFGRSMSKPTTQYKFNLLCMDRETGNPLWEKTVCQVKPHQGHHGDHGFASFTPVTDGKLVWATYGSRGIYCYDVDGNKVWSKELPTMTTMFGEGGSPSLAGDAVIVLADQRGDSFIFAFDKKTGALLWKKARDEPTSYATPLPVTVDGKLQVIVSATNFIRSYDVKTGDVIWQCSGQTRNVIPTPVVGSGVVYCTSGYRGNALQAIKLGGNGDLSNSDAVIWQVNERTTPYVPSPLLYGGRIYVCKGNDEVLSCYDAKTGTPHFAEQKMEEMDGVYASPTAAAGRIYFVGRNGVSYVLKPSDKFEVLAVNTLDDKIDCSPAFVGDEMYLKGKQNLYCIAASK